MRVNVSELLADRDGVRVLTFSEQLPPPGDDAAFVEPVAGEIELGSAGAVISLRGRVRTAVRCVCGACLRQFTLPLVVDVTEEFDPRGGSASEAGGQGPDGRDERELTAGDFLVPVGTAGMIDVTEIVRQHVVLAIPLAPRCREDCPGLCPRCGADLNAGACGCDSHDVDPRLDVLRRWPTRSEGE